MRVAAAYSFKAASVAANKPTASSSERGVKRSRSVAGCRGMRPYSTGVADAAPPTGNPAPLPVRTVDLDWRSVVVVLAGFVGLVALTGVVRSAPRTITAVIIGT